MSVSHRPLLVLPFHPFPAHHGGAAAAGALIEGLAASHPVRIVTPEPHHRALVPTLDLTVTSVRLERFTRLLRAMGPAFSRRLARAARRAASRHQADILQAETIWAVPAAAKAARHADCPLIYTAHNAEAAKLRGLGFSYGVVAMTRRLERRALREAAATVVFSPEDADRLGHSCPSARGRLHCFGPAVRCATPALPEEQSRLRAKWGLDPDAILLLFSGNLDYRPNTDALRILRREVAPRLRHAGAPVQFIVAGSGDRTDRDSKDPEFHDTGHVTDDEFAELLQIADIVPAPMQGGSGVSIKVLEAMGAGAAVVTTSAGMRGLRAEAGHHLIVVADAEGMADEIIDLAADEPRRRSIGSNGRRYVLEHHAPEGVASSYLHLYDRFVSGG